MYRTLYIPVRPHEYEVELAHSLTSQSQSIAVIWTYNTLVSKFVQIKMNGYPYDSCIPCAWKIKHNIKIPVIGVGMVRDAEFARQAIKKGLCDLLGIGRALLADSEFVAKTLAHRDDEIIPWKD